MRVVLSPAARRTRSSAAEYFESQRSLFEESRRRVQLHPYFARLRLQSADIPWTALIEHRMALWGRLYQQEGLDDFRVEKDRCEMYRFFQRAGLPHSPLLGVWHDLPRLVQQLRTGAAMANASRWPIFLKACHMTQGTMKAVLPIESPSWALSNVRQLEAWVRDMWVKRADDWERSWRQVGNALTDTLTPGMMLQDGWHTAYNPYKGRHMAVELKVETFWGRAYLAVTSDLQVGTVFRRDNRTELYPSLWAQAVFAAEPERRMQWIVGEGHLQCAWELAERAARVIGAEAVRIDIFLRKGHPRGCIINEISLSSGMTYSMHPPFLARTWAEGLLAEHSVRQTTKRVYEQTLEDVPLPPHPAPGLRATARSE